METDTAIDVIEAIWDLEDTVYDLVGVNGNMPVCKVKFDIFRNLSWCSDKDFITLDDAIGKIDYLRAVVYDS